MPENSAGPTFIQAFLKSAATLGFVGYLPYAPGTWGSLAGLLAMSLAVLSVMQQAGLILSGIVIGTVSSGAAEKVTGEKDCGHIVIDEFAGMCVSLFALPQTPGYLFSAFLLFRVFDILKPFPICFIERRIKGGAGIMADDIAAGMIVNGILQVWMRNF